MSNSILYRWGGIALIAAGVATALFWIMVLPFETFAGAEAALHSLQTPAQVFHVLGALLAVFGYMGLYLRQRAETGRLGLIGFVLAVAGAALFFADGIIGLFISPALAAYDSSLVEATGPMFTGRVLVAYILIAATNMTGIALLGISVWRAGVMPRTAALLFTMGGIMFNLPPSPALHLVIIAGGVIWAVGAVWLGYMLRLQPIRQ